VGERLFVVANPAAAGGSVGESWEDIASTIRSVLGPFAWALTERTGHATELVRRALEQGYDVIGSLGGDGTHNEVVNGFFEGNKPIREGAALAILPFGTGGDFRKTLGLSGELVQSVLRLARGEPSPCDVGHLRFVTHGGQEAERTFINITSFGLGGLVDKKVNEGSKALGGKVSFLLGSVKALAEFVPRKVRLTVDGETSEVVVNNVAVANGRYFGGGMKIAPHAELDDGLFDVVILRPQEFGELLSNAIKLYEGRHFESAAVSLLRGKAVFAEPVKEGDRILLDVDGEALGRLPATFTILPKAIQLYRTPG
jgi:YegS/Rv2252/BmrU family lipid kinase